eukprot:4007860-Pleurochrysis_carterae.AAC.2
MATQDSRAAASARMRSCGGSAAQQAAIACRVLSLNPMPADVRDDAGAASRRLERTLFTCTTTVYRGCERCMYITEESKQYIS